MTTNCKKAQGISLKIQNWVNSPNEKWWQLSFGFQLENRNSISLHQFNGDLLAIVGHHGYTEDQFIQKVFIHPHILDSGARMLTLWVV